MLTLGSFGQKDFRSWPSYFRYRVYHHRMNWHHIAPVERAILLRLVAILWSTSSQRSNLDQTTPKTHSHPKFEKWQNHLPFHDKRTPSVIARPRGIITTRNSNGCIIWVAELCVKWQVVKRKSQVLFGFSNLGVLEMITWIPCIYADAITFITYPLLTCRVRGDVILLQTDGNSSHMTTSRFSGRPKTAFWVVPFSISNEALPWCTQSSIGCSRKCAILLVESVNTMEL